MVWGQSKSLPSRELRVREPLASGLQDLQPGSASASGKMAHPTFRPLIFVEFCLPIFRQSRPLICSISEKTSELHKKQPIYDHLC